MRRSLEVADIFRAFGPRYRRLHSHNMPVRHLRLMRAVEVCRTAQIGGHVDECDRCGALRISYNSCRNRHCPKCQSLEKERWLLDRNKDLLPTHYFHVVFTLPLKLRPLALGNQRALYNLLFKAAARALTVLAEDPKYLGAQIGVIAVLHTWTQTLIDHPHLHCIVTAGGLSRDGREWSPWRKGLFIPVKVLSRLFRGIFLDGLRSEYDSGHLRFSGAIDQLEDAASFERFLAGLYSQAWVVYCKATLRKPEAVMNYLGRYTHRVALSNDRLVKIEDNQVTFRWRDSARHNKIRHMNLNVMEFIRRFLLHVLPDRFVKIRYYGILSHRNRKTKLSRCKKILGVQEQEKTEKLAWQDLLHQLTGIDPRVCPLCRKGNMVTRGLVLASNIRPQRRRPADTPSPHGRWPP